VKASSGRILSIRWYAGLALVAGLAAACLPATLESDSATPSVLATPYSQEPAAGICTEPKGNEVVMRLEPGIPDPRCAIVLPSQHLRVINHNGAEVTVALGPFSTALPPNGETVFDAQFGDYLMAGVHALQVDPCCGGELWLKE